MSFQNDITRVPLAFDGEIGGSAISGFPDVQGGLRDLLVGAAGCSPYLAGLIQREAGWLSDALTMPPRQALDAAWAEIGDAEPGQLPVALRRAKRRTALLVALADLGGIWPLEEVTGALTRFADLAVGAALRSLVGAQIARGKLPPVLEPSGDTAGMVVLAMGKMGAGELNYSSDIDLICLFDETRFVPDDWGNARAAFVRVTRLMTAMLSDLTGEGYVFRTDLRLRPDPGVTPVCMAMAAAERYYESLGRTWERAAHIKARAAAGDIKAGEAYLHRLTPFVWRRHLDFAAIQDAHDMARRIRDHKGLAGPITLPGHNVKLGRGGIREIEFFAQTGQLIYGGRDDELRQRGTCDALAALAERGRITRDTAEVLTGDYRALREIEHRLQMINDAQTHVLPSAGDGFDRLARFMGEGDTAAFKSQMFERLTRVHALTEDFLAPSGPVTKAAGKPVADDQFREITARWRSYPALRSSRAVESFGRLRADLMHRFSKAARPDQAIAVFDSFLAGLPAGAQLFALFEANPQLVDLIVDIAATAPGLARYLSRNAGVFDAVIAGDFFSDWPGTDALTAALAEVLSAEDDYEAKLDAARRWVKEWHFRIGVHHLRGLIDAAEAGAQYAELAEAVLGGVFPAVQENFAAKHGAPPGRGATILGMGSLGAGKLNANSDLDLIVIYDAAGIEASEGRRPLAARAYYARLTQALVTALSAPMAEGRLYEVDMRLRPSGRQGPVATSLEAFTSYQQTQAWTWEHLALTRARAVAGASALATDVEAFRGTLLKGPRDRAKVLTDVRDMRARLSQEKPGNGEWDAKLGVGRLQDIELVAETAALLSGSSARDVASQLQSGVAIGWLTGDEGDALSTAFADLWTLNAAAKLLTDRPLKPEEIGAGGQAFLLRSFGRENLADLTALLDGRANEAAKIIDEALMRDKG